MEPLTRINDILSRHYPAASAITRVDAALELAALVDDAVDEELDAQEARAGAFLEAHR